jgi:hypothetical protein
VCGAQEEYVMQIHFFNPVAYCFLYKAKDLSATFVNAGRFPVIYFRSLLIYVLSSTASGQMMMMMMMMMMMIMAVCP